MQPQQEFVTTVPYAMVAMQRCRMISEFAARNVLVLVLVCNFLRCQKSCRDKAGGKEAKRVAWAQCAVALQLYCSPRLKHVWCTVGSMPCKCIVCCFAKAVTDGFKWQHCLGACSAHPCFFFVGANRQAHLVHSASVHGQGQLAGSACHCEGHGDYTS